MKEHYKINEPAMDDIKGYEYLSSHRDWFIYR